jgi:MYXO-CTERM domain-containing protein
MNCGCSTSGRGTPSMLWLGLVGLVIAARKRQR